jgi:PAS domain S-box-containing protein
MANEQGFGESRFGWRTVARLRSMFDRSRNAMLIADDQRRWVNGNAAAADLLGIPREQIPWHRMDDFTSPSDHRALEERWTAFLGGGAAEGWYQLWIETLGSAPPLEFSATANVQPSRHLAVFIPPEKPSTAPARSVVAEWTLLPESGSAPELTRREREVMTLLASGLQGNEIAERLALSPETVKSHVRNALAKLGRRTRAGGVAIALITGQIDW